MTERNRLRSLGMLAYVNGAIPIRRQPLYLVNLVASPLSFLFFIAIASSGRYLSEGITGGMLLTVMSIGTSLQTDLAHYRQDLKFQDVMVASPVEAPVYVGGLALSELIYSLPGMSVFVALWALHGQFTPAAGATLVGVLLLAWALSSALGFTLATYFEDVRETFAFSPLVSLTLTVLPPVYYPASALPVWAQHVALLSPTTYAADLLHTSAGPTLLPPYLDWLALVGFTLGLLLLTSYKARWRDP